MENMDFYDAWMEIRYACLPLFFFFLFACTAAVCPPLFGRPPTVQTHASCCLLVLLLYYCVYRRLRFCLVCLAAADPGILLALNGTLKWREYCQKKPFRSFIFIYILHLK